MYPCNSDERPHPGTQLGIVDLLNQFAEAEAQKAKATKKVTLRVRITAHSLPKKVGLPVLPGRSKVVRLER
jgi:hypothetical protein